MKRFLLALAAAFVVAVSAWCESITLGSTSYEFTRVTDKKLCNIILNNVVDELLLETADLDKNGSITVSDVVYLVNMIIN